MLTTILLIRGTISDGIEIYKLHIEVLYSNVMYSNNNAILNLYRWKFNYCDSTHNIEFILKMDNDQYSKRP